MSQDNHKPKARKHDFTGNCIPAGTTVDLTFDTSGNSIATLTVEGKIIGADSFDGQTMTVKFTVDDHEKPVFSTDDGNTFVQLFTFYPTVIDAALNTSNTFTLMADFLFGGSYVTISPYDSFVMPPPVKRSVRVHLPMIEP